MDSPDITRSEQAGSPDADISTRAGRDGSLRALQLVEYALTAPAPRRERTWIHRITLAVDAFAEAVDRQIRDNDDAVGLLSEIALSQPDFVGPVVAVRDEQRALRVAIASIREQLDDHPELPLDMAQIRERLASVARLYRQHRTKEADLIRRALAIDVSEPVDPPEAFGNDH